DGAKEPPGKDIVGEHQRNFIAAIHGDAKPNAEIEVGHKSTRLCHLGNIAYRTRKVLTFDAKTETTDDATANKLLGREYRKGFELPGVGGCQQWDADDADQKTGLKTGSDQINDFF